VALLVRQILTRSPHLLPHHLSSWIPFEKKARRHCRGYVLTMIAVGIVGRELGSLPMAVHILEPSGRTSMPRYIVTGNYTASAMKAMVENPSDREAAARAIVEAAGGTLENFYLTTGDADFAIKVTIEDATDLIAGMMATAAGGAVSNLKTIRAFTSDEFTAMQKRAGEIASAYKAPGS
jgi:uncharacterized protein with GYD domain